MGKKKAFMIVTTPLLLVEDDSAAGVCIVFPGEEMRDEEEAAGVTPRERDAVAVALEEVVGVKGGGDGFGTVAEFLCMVWMHPSNLRMVSLNRKHQSQFPIPATAAEA